jgi:EpsI family protein
MSDFSPNGDPAPETASQVTYLALIAFLVLVAAFGWWLYVRMPAEHDADSIERVALRLDEWTGIDIPMEESVEQMLRADSQVQRLYDNPDGEFVWLYVGYYGTERGGRPEHTPWECYPSGGWQILASEERSLDVDNAGVRGRAMKNEFVVEKEGERRLVHFWYATHRSTAIASDAGLTVDHLLGRLSPTARADGALIRISTPLASDVEGVTVSRDRLQRFSVPLVREIRSRWPGAGVPGGGAPTS